MKKGYWLIALVLCIGLLIAFGALNVSATQLQLSKAQDFESTQVFDRTFHNEECRSLDPRLPEYRESCAGELDGHKYQIDQVDQYQAGEAVPDIEDRQSLPMDVAMQHTPAGPDLGVKETGSLSVYVVRADGLPGSSATLEVYTSNGQYTGYAITNADGYANLELPDGVYDLMASSSIYHFFIYQQDVIAPGLATLSAVGTPEVTVTAKTREGISLANAEVDLGVSNGDYWIDGWVGTVEANGQLVFHTTPNVYDVSLVDWDRYYVLYSLGTDFTAPVESLNFDMSTQPSAEIVANHPYDNGAKVVVGSMSGNVYGWIWTDLPSGVHFVVNANLRYRSYQELVRYDQLSNYWGYVFYPARQDLTFAPGEVYNFNVGGTATTTGRTEPATAGDWITLATSTDSFGSTFTYVFTSTEQFGSRWYIYPQVQLTDPNGVITNIEYTGGYRLPGSFPTGIYSMHFEWDTGPYQGLLSANSQFTVLPFTGLAVYVETADGQPAAYVSVVAYKYHYYSYYTNTDSSGYAYLDLPPGIYTVYAASSGYLSDHFFLYHSSVSSPGNITLSAVGTPQISLTALKKDGAPLNQAVVFVGSTDEYWAYDTIGFVDPDGTMVFHVTPDIYDIGVEDAANLYGLYKVDQDLTTSTSVIFDASTEPSSEIEVSHPNDSYTNLYLCPSANLDCFGTYQVADGARIVVSTGLGYYTYQYVYRMDSYGNEWNYQFVLDLVGSYFDPGELVTFGAGGALNVIPLTDDIYIDTDVRLANVMDESGSYLTNIYYHTPDYYYTDVYPEILLTDPNGFESILDWFWYYFSVFAPTGMYDMHFEWDTGEPYQGVISADSQFEVLPQETTGIISPEGGELYSPWDDTLYEFAPGTFTGTVIITHTVKYTGIPEYFPKVGWHFYDVTAVYSDTGLPATPTQPYTLTIGYTDWERGPAIEDTLGLYNWDGLQWALETTGTFDPLANQLVATPDHFSPWGILGETNRTYMMLISRH